MKTIIAALLAVALPTFGYAQSLDVNQLDSIIRTAVAEKHIVGLSVGVMQNGKVVLDRGYGVRDLTTKAPVTSKTIFGVGSVTKQFTCAAALMLAEQGKLSFNDPVAKWYPNLMRAKDITTH
jgi:D-alanyl-D-alanine carboxypeptidase